MDGSGNSNGAVRPPSIRTTPRTPFFTACICRMNGKSCRQLTLNYGARFDLYSSSFDNENQVSPRANLVYQPTDSTTLHAGYSRYFTPPPLETVPSSDTGANSTGTIGSDPAFDQDTRSRPSAPNYYDVGISQTARARIDKSAWTAIIKPPRINWMTVCSARSLILSSFNYSEGRVRGVEFTGRLRPPAASPPMPTSPTRWPRAKRRFGPIPAGETSMWSITSTITGFTWTTISASPARSAWRTPGRNRRAQPRAFMWTRFTAPACGRTADLSPVTRR